MRIIISNFSYKNKGNSFIACKMHTFDKRENFIIEKKDYKTVR